MKRILCAIALSFCSTIAAAQQVVELIWPFSIASSTTNYVRLVIDQANKNQKDFKFVLVQRAGAGGVIAANATKNSNVPALLVTSNAFFVRPYLFPAQSYQFSEFVPVIVMGAMPMGFIGRTNSNWTAILSNEESFVGVPGVGSFSYVLASILKEKYPQITIVPYQGTTEALKDVASGELTMSLDVPSMVSTHKGLVIMHYITGNNNYDNQFKLLRTIDPKFSDISLDLFVAAPATMDPVLVARLRAILKNAHNNNVELTKLYKAEFVTLINDDPLVWYQNNIAKWKNLTMNIKIEQ